MIAGIDSQCDITVYLKPEEIDGLQTQTLEGVLVKIPKPKKQGKLYISINDKRQNENGFGIGVNDKAYWGKVDDFIVELFMGREFYEELRERGVIGMRQRMRDGSKVTVERIGKYNESEAENLEGYRDNREKLCDELG